MLVVVGYGIVSSRQHIPCMRGEREVSRVPTNQLKQYAALATVAHYGWIILDIENARRNCFAHPGIDLYVPSIEKTPSETRYHSDGSFRTHESRVPMRSHLAMTAGRSSNRPVPTMKAIVAYRRYIRRLYSSIVTTRFKYLQWLLQNHPPEEKIG